MEKKSNPSDSKKKRGPGRPRKSERPVTPEVLNEIAELWLKGKSSYEIGLAIGVAKNAVDHHLEHVIRPAWRKSLGLEAKILEARSELLIRLFFQGYERSLRDKGEERQKQVQRKRDDTAAKAMKAAKGDARLEQLVERTVTRGARDGDKGWLLGVLDVMDFQAKLAGLYAPSRHSMHVESELRVAGLTPAELDEKMLRRAAELIVERQRHQQILETRFGNPN
jgi:hypothetical protein